MVTHSGLPERQPPPCLPLLPRAAAQTVAVAACVTLQILAAEAGPRFALDSPVTPSGSISSLASHAKLRTQIVLEGANLYQTVLGLYAAEQSFSTPVQPVLAAVAPHHLVSSEAMAAGIRSLTGAPAAPIILLSPDHFHACPTHVCTAAVAFQTPFGQTEADGDLVERLAAETWVTVDPAPLAHDHGITALVPMVAHQLPGARVTPLLLSQRKAWNGQRNALAGLLREAVASGARLLVSSDFSHYLPVADADAADHDTMLALMAGDLDGIAGLRNPAQSDCPICLWLLARVARAAGFYNPAVLRHTNSARLDPTVRPELVPETTSHFAMAWYADASLGTAERTTRNPLFPCRLCGKSLRR